MIKIYSVVKEGVNMIETAFKCDSESITCDREDITCDID